MRTLISNATIVNEGVSVTGHIVIDGDTITSTATRPMAPMTDA